MVNEELEFFWRMELDFNRDDVITERSQHRRQNTEELLLLGGLIDHAIFVRHCIKKKVGLGAHSPE